MTCIAVHCTAVIRNNHTQIIQILREYFTYNLYGVYFYLKPIELFTPNHMPANKLFPSSKLFKIFIPHFLGANKYQTIS